MDSNIEMINSCNDLIEMLSDVDGGLDTTSRKFMTTASNIEAAARRIEAAARAAVTASGGASSFTGGNNNNSGNNFMLDWDPTHVYPQVKLAPGANVFFD